METGIPRRFGAYHRVSDANGRTIDADTTMTHKVAFDQIDAWAKLRGHTIAERYLDWDTTGSKMDRPELDRMLADLEAGAIDGIVVAQVDRLSRADVGDALAVVKQIAGDNEAHPRPLVLLDLGIDPSTEFGEFGLTILLGLARMQWRRYQRQWATHRGRAVSRGVWVGPAPLGYVRGPDGALDLDPARSQVVRDAFLIAAADGIHAAARHLQRELPAMRWRTSDVRRILRNRAYIGEHHADSGPGHDPITTPTTFHAAQTDPRGRRTNGDYPLSGVATCVCGEDLVGGIQAANGRRRYRCSGYNRGTCRGGVTSVPADDLEQWVRDQLALVLADDDVRLSFDPDGSAGAETALASAEQERDRFAQDAEAHELLGDVPWRAGLRTRAARVAEARDALELLASRAAQSVQLPLPDELDDPLQFIRALAVVGSLVLRGGRGTIADRVVEFLPVDDDLNDGAGMPAP